jgi:hypothetical protein
MQWDESSRDLEIDVIKLGGKRVSETQKPGWNILDDAVRTRRGLQLTNRTTDKGYIPYADTVGDVNAQNESLEHLC